MTAYTAGLNIAMKIPKAQYEATVAFYRDTLGFEVKEEDVGYAPTVATTHSVKFGPNTLWLDRVDNYSHPDLWLQLHTDDLDAATAELAEVGVHPCDEVEPLENLATRTHWIKNPAGVVHLLAESG
ncbi:VOC family protein [Nonomuraea endophytica]|uniref:Catechol 2,3-dioxygenase-like lactoylglutathione lyase family enzyme n=1 Tax=Nonomuraea endophytica TaxID=714136 RepID=A0A7W8A3Z5_9ACTN|nr:VOC family protein [Nonomuraea endophytica]MBB5079162.1 catechol 2,3-dioxygenase-like lactoylglutathione lyase family enzyme [Nonomuraea endophytica]